MPIVLYLSQRPTKADGEYTGKSSLRFSKSWSPETTIEVLIAASAGHAPAFIKLRKVARAELRKGMTVRWERAEERARKATSRS